MRFIGLDLAWSPRNKSGGVAIEDSGGHARWLDASDRLGDDEQVLAFVREMAEGSKALVAIDAPLIVPNAEGSRPVDREITRLFARYQAGCYPAYRNRPGGCTRGERIVAALAEDDFKQDPYLKKRAAVCSVFEVYPHPATISLFHLETTIKYKPRPDRTLDFRRCELRRLRDCLQGLERAEPALYIPAAIASAELSDLGPAALKRHEDLLDAIVCAYIAYYAWYWGRSGYQVYGDTALGYILVPMTAWMQERLERDAKPPQRSV
jgi:predicted RNase H-like nuclease